MTVFRYEYCEERVVVVPEQESQPWYRRLFSVAQTQASLPTTQTSSDISILSALAEIRQLAAEDENEDPIQPERIVLSHAMLSRLSDATAQALRLPRAVDYLLEMEIEGTLGSPSFQLQARWMDGPDEAVTERIGAILKTSTGTQRIPAPLLRAVVHAENASAVGSGSDLASHWEQLALFRNALEPDSADPDSLPDQVKKCRMSSFLHGLRLRSCSSLAIKVRGEGLQDFDPVPFGRLDNRNKETPELGDGLLDSQQLEKFQCEFRNRGATYAYSLGNQEYLILPPAIQPVANLMATKQRASIEERTEFLENPEPYVREVLRDAALKVIRDAGPFDAQAELELEEEIEEEIDKSLDEKFVITVEYRDRVLQAGVFRRPDLQRYGATLAATTWLPESIPEQLHSLIKSMSAAVLLRLKEDLQAALDNGQIMLSSNGSNVPVDAVTIEAVERELKRKQTDGSVSVDNDPASPDSSTPEPVQQQEDDIDKGNIVLTTSANHDNVDWYPTPQPRLKKFQPEDAADAVRSTLMAHQVDSLHWQQEAWCRGLTGVLNADEQGLGKTLQTLAFLAWLHAIQKSRSDTNLGPMLIVAPTSLLRNWEAEIETHLHRERFAVLTRLYGAAIRTHREPGAGTDLDLGRATLDLDWLTRACERGDGGNHLLLTTYKTMANYHHSLHGIGFSVIVYDEMQNLKNPATLLHAAARSLRADFQIGLTGTPIENSTTDLWSIMDLIAPGALGSLKDFSEEFGTPDTCAMKTLHSKLFDRGPERPAVGLRRLKNQVTSDLPAKHREFLPAEMPERQAIKYMDARQLGGGLKLLHHLRSVSVHPGLLHAPGKANGAANEDSARILQLESIIHKVAKSGERILVFVEHRRLQYLIAEWIRSTHKLDKVEVINGKTSIPKRQQIVNHFQRHLEHNDGFDALVLGPKAAGVGLTLTAANHVVHLSRWWNPAVEEQCNDRVHRIGQSRQVTVHVPIAVHPDLGPQSFDCLLQKLMLRKRTIASGVLAPMGDTESDVGELINDVSSENENLILPSTVTELREWAQARLEKAGGQIDASNDPTAGTLLVFRNKHESHQMVIERANRLYPEAGRIVVLSLDKKPHLHTHHLDSGIAVTELAGSMLGLWPAATLESEKNVVAIVD